MTDASETADNSADLPKTAEPKSLWLATGGGIGHTGFAPGTLGALWGVPLAYAINSIPAVVSTTEVTGDTYTRSFAINYGLVALQLLIIAALIWVGIGICQKAADYFGKSDPSEVVWDEIATVPLTFFMVPMEEIHLWTVVIAGFLLHRVFDISKIPPIRQLEKLPGGLGIMADDVGAAVMSCLCLHGLRYAGVFDQFINGAAKEAAGVLS